MPVNVYLDLDFFLIVINKINDCKLYTRRSTIICKISTMLWLYRYWKISKMLLYFNMTSSSGLHYGSVDDRMEMIYIETVWTRNSSFYLAAGLSRKYSAISQHAPILRLWMFERRSDKSSEKCSYIRF